jgi:hypothetical protein
MLFLVFDIELVLLLPISVSLSQISTFGFVTAIVFFIVLTIGFIFEIGVGALSLKSENKNITPNQDSNQLVDSKQSSLSPVVLIDKSRTLKNKLESGLYILSNLDLSIFKVVFEDLEQIVLKHVDIYNRYKVEVSILKYNPQIRGNLLFYFLTYTELDLNSKETIKFKKRWLKPIDSGFIGTGNHSLELYIENNRILLIADGVRMKNTDIQNDKTGFIINGELVNIGKNLRIHFKNIFSNTNDFITLTVNFNVEITSSNVITLNLLKNKKVKLDQNLKLDQRGKIISAFNLNSQIKQIKTMCKLIESVILKNIPIVFYAEHFDISINKYMEINDRLRKEKLDLFLRSKNNNLISTFLSLLTKDDKGKNIFNILHLNHSTGYISNHMNIKTYMNLNNVLKKGFKENLKLCKFILNEISTSDKNNELNLIQLSLNFLGSVITINPLRKNILLRLLNKIEDTINIKFEIIDITKYRKQECLQLFYIIYNNNPNIKLEVLIKNYNALIKKRKKTIENTFFRI